MRPARSAAVVAAIVVVGLAAPRPAAAYSVLTHEANIDAVWDSTLAPMLAARSPDASPEAIQSASMVAEHTQGGLGKRAR